MDTIFRDLTATGEVVIYMDDILIATPNNTPHHRQIVHQVLDKLEEHDLFLKPEKCTFEVPEIEYLGLIIGGGRVRMDRVKVQKPSRNYKGGWDSSTSIDDSLKDSQKLQEFSTNSQRRTYHGSGQRKERKPFKHSRG